MQVVENNAVGESRNGFRRYRGFVVVVGLVMAVLPFVALAFYNHPTLDDFLDASRVKEAGVWEAQKFYYVFFTGRYTTTALLASINPLIYSRVEAIWWVTLAFILGTLLVLALVLRALVGLARQEVWLGAGLLSALWLAFAPGQAEGLYWFTGAYTYIATAWVCLLWLVVAVRYADAKRAAGRTANSKWWLALLSLLTIGVAGTPEPVALPFLVALVAGAGASKHLGCGRTLWLLAALAALGCGVSFGAPGNAVRMEVMGTHFSILKTLCYSAAATGYLLLTWVANPVLLLLSAMLLPRVYRIAQQRELFLVALLARIPAGLLAAGLGALLAAASCPAYYASGTGLPLRTRTMLYLFFIVGWFGVLLTWCCRQVRLGKPSAAVESLAAGRLAPLWAALLVLFFFADYNVQTRASRLGLGSNNVIRAYQQWLGGDAARYDVEMRNRYRVLTSPLPVVTLLPLKYRPDLLCSFDMADITDAELLRQYARYFGKKQVITHPDPRADAGNAAP